MSLTSDSSIHIPYDQAVQFYHRKIAGLTARHAPSDAVVVDIGCGVGHTLQLISEHRPDLKLIGVDFDENCLRIAASRIPALETYVQDINQFSLGDIDSDIDFLIMSHVLEHMYRPCDIVNLVLEKLKDGGHMVLAVPNPVRPLVMLNNLFRRFAVNKGHLYAWDRSHWINLLENVLQLRVLAYECDYVQLVPEAYKKNKVIASVMNPLELFLCRIIPWFSFSNIALIQKQ